MSSAPSETRLPETRLLAQPQRVRRLTRRGADTRERILAATIACIVRSGFAAMTVENVMAEAGISRGSVLHQFPTRVALATAAAHHAMDMVMEGARLRAEAIPDAFERLANYAQIAWDTHSAPEGLALTEILQAAGWDRDLAEAIRPIAELVERQVSEALVDLAREAGIADDAAVVARGWLLMSTARGLIIEYRLYEGRTMIAAAIAEMKASHRRFCETLRNSGAKNSQS